MGSLRERALVVDDDRLSRTMLRDMLSPHLDVKLAGSGQEALEILDREPFAVVISDHIMPGVTGVEVLTRCITLRPQAVRILVTASQNIKDIRDAVNLARVHRVIVKPLHEVEVESIVLGALRERELERENERLVRELREALDSLKAREQELEHELKVRTDELREVMAQVAELRDSRS